MLNELEKMAITIIEKNDSKDKIADEIARRAVGGELKAASVKTLCHSINMFRLHRDLEKQASPKIDLVAMSDIVGRVRKHKEASDKKVAALNESYDLDSLVRDGARGKFYKVDYKNGWVNKPMMKTAADEIFQRVVSDYDSKMSEYMVAIGRVRSNEETLKKAITAYADYDAKAADVLRLIKEVTDKKAVKDRLFRLAKTACLTVDLRKVASRPIDGAGFVNWSDPLPSKMLEYINSLKSAATSHKRVEEASNSVDSANERVEKIHAL